METASHRFGAARRQLARLAPASLLLGVAGLTHAASAPFPKAAQPPAIGVQFMVPVTLPPARAVLYYRVPGSRNFLPLDLDFDADRVVVKIPPTLVREPGLEYFLVVEGAVDQRQTFPAEYPQYNPYLLTVAAAPNNKSTLANPSGAPDQAVRITLPPNQAPPRVLLDGTEVTESMITRGSELIYEPPVPLDAGDHQITLIDGNERVQHGYRVSGEPDWRATSAGNDYMELTGRASFNYGGNMGGQNSQGSSASANMHIEGGMQRGRFQGQWSGVDVRWVDDGADPVTLSSGFLVNGSYRGTSAELGDVSINEVPLVVSGFARRGLQVGFATERSMTRFFNVRTDPIEGFNMGLSFDTEQQTYGVAHERDLNENWSVHASMVSGAEKSAAGFNTASLLSPAEGDTAGLQVRGQALGTDIDVEYATSKFDDNVLDDVNKVRDDAYRVNLSRTIAGLNLSGGYLRYGSDYATIANPNFTGDRESLDLSLASGWGIFSWSVSGSQTWDNVDNDPTRARVGSDVLSANFSLAPARWPMLQIGLSQANQDSSREPDGIAVVENTNTNVSLALSHNIGPVAWNLTSAFGHLDDDLDATRDADVTTHSLSTSYSLGRFSVAPTFTWNEIETSARTDRSRLATLSSSVPLGDTILISAQLSYQHSDATDNSVDTELIGGGMRLAWTLQDLLGTAIPDRLNFQFGLSATYNKINDAINADAQDEQLTLLLTFNLGAPFDFNLRRNFNEPPR